MQIDQDGGANTWIRNACRSCQQALHLMRRVMGRVWGIKEAGFQQIALALVVSKMMYAFPYVHTSHVQSLQLE